MMETEAISITGEKYVSRRHAKGSFAKMKEMLISQKLTDVTLDVSGVEIIAHKLVLSSASDYFQAMFTGNLLEANLLKIQMKETDPNALKALVEFCYSGEIDLSEDNVERILSTANLLRITEVVEACCNFIAPRLHPSNCIGISSFSESQGCMELHLVAYRYVMDHFSDVILNTEYLSLSYVELRKLLCSDMLNILSEEEAFQCLINWVTHDVFKRKGKLSYLFEAIKLPLLSPQFLADNVETNPLFKDDPVCKNLIIEAMKYHLLPERRSLLHSYRIRPRKSTVGDLFVIGGSDGSKGTTQIDKYNYRDNSWMNYGCMTSVRLQFGAAVVDDKLYVVGGRDGLKTLSLVECYDFKNKSWTTLPSMHVQRHGLGIGVLDGLLYAVGGHDGWTYLNVVERWDPKTQSWSQVESLNTPRCSPSVAALNGRLYAIGGKEGGSCLISVESYDPHRNKWTFCAPLNVRRSNTGVGAINGFLFVLGGHDCTASNLRSSEYSRYNCVERYDPQTDTWTLVAKLSSCRDAMGVSVLGDRLISVGGFDGQNYLSVVEAYDPQTNRWEQLRRLDIGKAGLCAVVVKK